MNESKLRIGILNIMHDKEDTQKRYDQALKTLPLDVDVEYFYPASRYPKDSVPDEIAKISSPLNLKEVRNFDGFIITGFAAETIPFENITFIDEIKKLIDELNRNNVEQLYFCWGAMIALNYLYGIEKHPMPEKLFGVYKNRITHHTNLLNGFNHEFFAPHARYTEMDYDQVKQNPALEINAETLDKQLFLVSSIEHPEQNFLFSHMEYGQDALDKEYQREVAAHPEKEYKRPENTEINWDQNQRRFFFNWLEQVSSHKIEKSLLAI